MRRMVALVALALLVASLAGVGRAGAQDAPTLPGVGDPVTFPASEGEGDVTITVTEIVDPFGAFGAGSPPEGSRYVYVVLTVANGGGEPLTFDPATVFVVDADGFVYRPADLFDPSTASQTVEPGGDVEGGVVFAVPEEAVLAAVYHDPADDRLVLLAVLGAAPAGGGEDGDESDGGTADGTDDGEADGDDGTASADDGGEADGGEADGGEDGGDGATSIEVGDVDCEEFAPYYEDITARIADVAAIGAQMEDLINLVQTDPVGAGDTVQGWADDIAALAEEQAQAEVPAGLEDLNAQAVQAMETYADGFSQLAAGLASLDATALQAVVPVLQEGDDLMTEVEDTLASVAEECGIDTE